MSNDATSEQIGRQGIVHSQGTLRFVWWNTGLTPRRSKVEKPESVRDAVVSLARCLFFELEVDVLALGEVSPEHGVYIQESLGVGLRTYFEDDAKTGIFVIYRADSLRLIGNQILVSMYVDKQLKRGCRLTFVSDDETILIDLVICHWPSRIGGQQSARERERLASDLREHLDDLASRGGRPLILIGDFNDEPFDKSMSDCLQGSRDRDLVKKRNSLLYNPFWRLLGEQQHLHEQVEGRLAAGTYFYRSDQLTRWFTFDQSLVSKELLGTNEWILDESAVGVLQMWPLLQKSGRIYGGFDHLPIVVTIRKHVR